MPQCTGTAVNIQLVVRDTQILHRSHGDNGKGFVDLEEIHRRHVPFQCIEQFLNGKNGCGGKPARFLCKACVAENACQRLRCVVVGIGPNGLELRPNERQVVLHFFTVGLLPWLNLRPVYPISIPSFSDALSGALVLLHD